MKYLAVVALSPYSKAEKICESEKDAHSWAFDMDGKIEKIVPLGKDYARKLLQEMAILYKPQITRNDH